VESGSSAKSGAFGQSQSQNASSLPTPRQYDSSQRIPVPLPHLHRRANRHIWHAEGLPYPYDSQNSHASVDRPVGAGTGFLNAASAAVVSVVDIQWSPTGLGRNRRCVLGVLLSNGVLVIYGEGSTRKFQSLSRLGYTTKDWHVLFAIGERFIVPPNTEYGEHISSFAWAGEIAPGKALLACKNDQDQVIIFAVQRRVLPAVDQKEQVQWKVREITRYDATGPHPPGNALDPDFVPYYTSYGLRWSPWITSGDGRVAAICVISRNHVGFRRIKLASNWRDDKLPMLAVDDDDLLGQCVHMGIDSFAEWEDPVRNQATRLLPMLTLCRSS
jgi:hypothetical protein